MNTMIYEFIGSVGAGILALSAAPQLLRTLRIKECGDLSIWYLVTLAAGLACVLIYACYLVDPILIFGNALSLSLTGALIFLWFRYRPKPQNRLHEKTKMCAIDAKCLQDRLSAPLKRQAKINPNPSTF